MLYTTNCSSGTGTEPGTEAPAAVELEVVRVEAPPEETPTPRPSSVINDAPAARVERKWSPALTTLLMCVFCLLSSLVLLTGLFNNPLFTNTSATLIHAVFAVLGPALGIPAALRLWRSDVSRKILARRRWPNLLLGLSTVCEVVSVVASGSAAADAAVIYESHYFQDLPKREWAAESWYHDPNWLYASGAPLLALNALIAACCALNTTLLLCKRASAVAPESATRRNSLPHLGLAFILISFVWGCAFCALTEAPGQVLVPRAAAPPSPPTPSSPSQPPWPAVNVTDEDHFYIESGKCKHEIFVTRGVDGQYQHRSCIMSSEYHDQSPWAQEMGLPRSAGYTDSEDCVIRAKPLPLEVEHFSTGEAGFDWLEVGGVKYSGEFAPHASSLDGVVPHDGYIYWHSNGFLQGSGWKICTMVDDPAPATPLQPGPGFYWHEALATARSLNLQSYVWALFFLGDLGALLGLALLAGRWARARKHADDAAAARAQKATAAADDGRMSGRMSEVSLAEGGGRVLTRSGVALAVATILTVCSAPIVVVAEVVLIQWGSAALLEHQECTERSSNPLAYNGGGFGGCFYQGVGGTNAIFIGRHPSELLWAEWVLVLVHGGASLAALGAAVAAVAESHRACGLWAVDVSRHTRLLKALMLFSGLVALWSAVCVAVGVPSGATSLLAGSLMLGTAVALYRLHHHPESRCVGRAGCGAPRRAPAVLHALLGLGIAALLAAAGLCFSMPNYDWPVSTGFNATLCLADMLAGLAYFANLINKSAASREESALLEKKVDGLTEQLEQMEMQQDALLEVVNAQASGVGSILRAQGRSGALPAAARGRARVDPSHYLPSAPEAAGAPDGAGIAQDE